MTHKMTYKTGTNFADVNIYKFLSLFTLSTICVLFVLALRSISQRAKVIVREREATPSGDDQSEQEEEGKLYILISECYIPQAHNNTHLQYLPMAH